MTSFMDALETKENILNSEVYKKWHEAFTRYDRSVEIVFSYESSEGIMSSESKRDIVASSRYYRKILNDKEEDIHKLYLACIDLEELLESFR